MAIVRLSIHAGDPVEAKPSKFSEAVTLANCDPPETVKSIAPLLPALQLTSVCVSDKTIADGWVTVTDMVLLHRLASVTVYVCVPADCVNVPVPL